MGPDPIQASVKLHKALKLVRLSSLTSFYNDSIFFLFFFSSSISFDVAIETRNTTDPTNQ
jgi:hypothetical protein